MSLDSLLNRDNEFWKKVYHFMLEHKTTKEEATKQIELFYTLLDGQMPEYRYCNDCRANRLVDREYDCCDDCGWSQKAEDEWETFWDDEH